jgi:hypothetical protein
MNRPPRRPGSVTDWLPRRSAATRCPSQSGTLGRNSGRLRPRRAGAAEPIVPERV